MFRMMILNKGDRVNTPLGSGEYRKMERLDAGCEDRYLVRIDDKDIAKQYNNNLLAFWDRELELLT